MNRSKIILLKSLHLPLIIGSLKRRLCLSILKTQFVSVAENTYFSSERERHDDGPRDFQATNARFGHWSAWKKCSCPQHPQTRLHDLHLQLVLQPPSPSSLIVIESANCVSILSALFSYSIPTSSSRRVVIPRKKS